MCPRKISGRLAGLGAMMLTLVGCTVSVQPWTKPSAPPGDPAHPNVAPPYGGGPPHPLPANIAAANESTSQLIRQMNDVDDHRKALLDQVQSLKKQLKERDENVRQASFEVDESTRSLKRTREELRQWQAEIEDLREKVRKLEDYRAALRPVIEEIVHQLDRENATPKTLRLPTPAN